MKKLLLLGALAMLPSLAAHADIIPTNDSITGSTGEQAPATACFGSSALSTSASAMWS